MRIPSFIRGVVPLIAFSLLPACGTVSLSDSVEKKIHGVKKNNSEGQTEQIVPPKPAYGALLPFTYLFDGLQAPIFVVQMIVAAMRGYRG